MTEYDNTNRGALFKNQRKESENHPDYTGSINVNGNDYWLSAWVKKDRNDKTYMSLSVKEKEAKPGRAKVETSPKRVPFDDEIPF